LNVGCVPSKMIIRSARVVAELRAAQRFGVRPSGVEVDFPAVMERTRRIRAGISHHDSAERFRALGVDVFLGEARFLSPDRVEVGASVLRFNKAVIATGARPVAPPIEGLAAVGYLTNETVFSLTERPRRLAVIGAGPIGCELAQAFALLGSEVTLIEKDSQLLIREDRDAAEMLASALARDGVQIKLGTSVRRVVVAGDSKVLHLESDTETESLPVDQILVGVGRAPNIEDLNLESAGVAYKRTGVVVNDYLQTTNSKIYAAGDVCLSHRFTHTADATARIVIQNSLFLGRKKLSRLTIPWCTYTTPEVAHVGMHEHDVSANGIELDTYLIPMKRVDRAITDGSDDGFVKIHVRKGSDQILGATIVAEHAGEMISEVTLAMVHGVGLGKISSVIHPYPTHAEGIKKVADAYNRTRLTPLVKKLTARWLAWTR